MSGEQETDSTAFVMVGTSYRAAPLDLLERVAVPGADLPGVLGELLSGEVAGVVVLSTCNRVEMYASCHRFHGGVEQLAGFMADRAGMTLDELAPHLSVLHDDKAVRHLFRVAAGAESVVPGETEILGQVQRALTSAETCGAVTPVLSQAFRHAVRVGRRARAETGLAAGTCSLPRLAVRRAAEELGGFRDRRILIMGAGEMGAAVAAALPAGEAGSVGIAGRGSERAAAVAAAVGGHVVAADTLRAALEQADVVFSATTAAGGVLDRRTCASIMARRPARPLVIVDLALPRDVDADVATLPGVTLFDLDSLRATVDTALERRRLHLPEVERLVTVEVEQFLRETAARQMSSLVSALRCRVEEVRRAELARWQGRLGTLDPQTVELIETVTSGVVAKLLHGPTVRLKDAGGTDDAVLYRDALVDLFDLGPAAEACSTDRYDFRRGGTRDHAA